MDQSAENRFRVLYERHGSDVWLYCRRRLSADRVDDAVADVFMAVWRHIDACPDADEVLPWLYRFSYLTVSNHWRSSRRKRRLDEKVSMAPVRSPETIADQVVMRDEVRRVVALLADLRPADAEVLRLAAWEGLGPSEIAEVLGVKPDAAKQRLSRARKRLTALHKRQVGSVPKAPPLLGTEVHREL